MTLKNIKLLHESLDIIVKLFNNYSPIVSEAKYKPKQREWLKTRTFTTKSR